MYCYYYIYTGAIYDETTGLHYLNARYYDPENGRFISQDTYRGDKNEISQWHLYAYCANNPINYTDPSGHALKTSTVAFALDIVFALLPWGGIFKVDTALKILKRDIFGSNLKNLAKKIAKAKGTVKSKFKDMYNNKFAKNRGNKSKSIGKIKNAVKKLGNVKNDNKFLNAICGELKSSAISDAVERIVKKFTKIKVSDEKKLILTAFSSAGNFIAAIAEDVYDRNYNGEFKR